MAEEDIVSKANADPAQLTSAGLPSSCAASSSSSCSATSRLTSSSAQLESQKKFRENEAKRLQADRRKCLQAEKEARDRALKGFQDDRESVKLRRGTGKSAAKSDKEETSQGAAATAEAKKECSYSAPSKVDVKVRLLDGGEYTDTFAASDCLGATLDCLCIQHPSVKCSEVVLMQPHPRCVYSESDLTRTFAELRFGRRVRLVLQARPPSAHDTVGQPSDSGGSAASETAATTASAATVSAATASAASTSDTAPGAVALPEAPAVQDVAPIVADGAALADGAMARNHLAEQLPQAEEIPELEDMDIGHANAPPRAADADAGVNEEAGDADVDGRAAEPAIVQPAQHHNEDGDQPDQGDEQEENIRAARPAGDWFGLRGRHNNGIAGAEDRPAGQWPVAQGHVLGGMRAGPNVDNLPPAAIAAGRRVLVPAELERVPRENATVKFNLPSVKSLQELAIRNCITQMPIILTYQPGFYATVRVPGMLASYLVDEARKSLRGAELKKVLIALRPSRMPYLKLDGHPSMNNDLMYTISTLPRLQSLSICNCTNLTPQCLPMIAKLQHLCCLDLSGCRGILNDMGYLTNFSHLKNLIHLDLNCCKLTDSKLNTIASSLRGSLLSLSACNTAITSHGLLAIIHHLPGIQQLYLSSTEIFSLDGIQRLSELRELALGSCALDNATIYLLGRLQKLRSLELFNMRMPGDVLTTAVENLSLDRLSLPLMDFCDGGAALVRTLSGFEFSELDLRNQPLLDVGLDASSLSREDVSGVRALLLSNTLITDAGIPHLLDFKYLRHLSLKHLSITGEALRHLQHLTYLLVLDLSFTGADDKLLVSRVLNELRYLESLNLASTLVSDRALPCLDFYNLSHLDISHIARFTDKPVAALLSAGCPNLVKLAAAGLRTAE